MYGIVKLKTDAILLSDLRIPGNNNNVVSNLKKSFICNPYCQYDFYYNSDKSSRGVGILLKKSIDFVVEGEFRDTNCNILALRINTKGEILLLIAIYGPNKYCDEFFVDLDRILSLNKGIPIVVGGDWNLTPSPLAAYLNPDVINMKNIPNERHTRMLQSLQIKYSLVDAFRVLHPDRRDFSYFPRDDSKNNRSRIDFFLISRECILVLSDCGIADGLQNKLFDHRVIKLSF
jgi:exonuclease III